MAFGMTRYNRALKETNNHGLGDWIVIVNNPQKSYY